MIVNLGSQPLKLSDMGSLINPSSASSLQARKGDFLGWMGKSDFKLLILTKLFLLKVNYFKIFETLLEI